MPSINQVVLQGYAGGEPRVKEWDNDSTSASVRIATTRYWRDKETKKLKEKTTWHTVEGSGYVAKKMRDKISKGVLVTVIGRNDNREYERDGQKMTYYFVKAERLDVTSKGGQQQEEGGTDDDLPF